MSKGSNLRSLRTLLEIKYPGLGNDTYNEILQNNKNDIGKSLLSAETLYQKTHGYTALSAKRLADKIVRGDNVSEKDFAFIEMAGREKTEFDFHNLTKKEAEEYLKIIIQYARANLINSVTLITGKGKHTQAGGPILRPLVTSILKQSHIICDVDETNAGRVIVTLFY